MTGKVNTLIGRVRGRVLTPGDAGYNEERAGFQTAVEHRPRLIVTATLAGDVRAAVQYASANHLPVAVQATGHGQPATPAGGILINTRQMTSVRVDAETRTAQLAAGVRWEQVIEHAAPYGLAPLSGSAPAVGAISYTLGGGLGLLARRYGYAADHVRAIDVVTADGRLRHVTAHSEPDLFWALPGGRSNFGVVCGLEIDLVPVPRLYGGGMYFAADLAADVLNAWRAWTATVPDEMTSSVALIPFPDAPAIPAPLRGRHVAHLRIAYTGEATTGERLVAPLRALGPRLIDSVDDMPYMNAGSIHNDPTEPMAYAAANTMLHGIDADAVRTVLDLAGPDAPVPCIIELRHLSGALASPPAVPNAVGHRDAAYLLNVLSRLDGFDARAMRAAHQRLRDALAPWSTGGRCLDFIYGEDATTDHVRSAYDPHDYQRLAELKAVHDPDNMFRLNHNIPPGRGRPPA